MTRDGVYAAMRAVMEDVSERAYCAGWMDDLSQRLWTELERRRGGLPLDGYGMWGPDEPRYGAALEALDGLSRAVEGGAWLVWDWHATDPYDGSDAGPRLVTWEEWLTRWYDKPDPHGNDCKGLPSDHREQVRS